MPAGAQILVDGGTLVNISSATRLRRGATTLDVADLKVGDQIHVLGTLQADASMSALLIEDRPTRTGSITSIAADFGAFSLSTGTLAVNAATTFGGAGNPKSLADFKVGDFIAVATVTKADGSLLAVMVNRF